VRVVVFVLLAVNVLYLAWAGWIHAPSPEPAVKEAAKEVPQLALVTEGIQRSASARMTASASVAATASAQPVVDSAPAPSGRCVSVGPFNGLAQAARAAALLKDRGFDPRQRAEAGEVWEGFWVYVSELRTAADEAQVMKALERAGIKDAHVMPATDDGRRVSVGLFSERGRAEKRAQAVKRLGFATEIAERQQAGSVYWVDLDVGTNDRSVPTEGLLSMEDSGSRLEIRVCPSGAPPATSPSRPTPMPRDARPAATTADARVPRPS
jgi:hypothetical protein